MRTDLQVVITDNAVYLKRPALTSLDRMESFFLTFAEVDSLITELQTVKAKAAKTKRVTAQRLLAEAEQLDPSQEAA